MTRTRNAVHTGAALVLALAFAVAAPVVASAATEQQQGAQVLSELKAGKLSGTSLTSTQYQHVGQYLMGRALGSRYEAMDSLMDRMMGQSVSDQMYQYMGERYLGKSVSPSSSYAPYYSWMANMMSRYGGYWAGMMGGYMMGAYNNLAGRGSATGGYRMGPGMMGYGYAPSQGANGSSPQGSTAGGYPVGPGMMGSGYALSSQNSAGGGISAGAIAAIVIGAIAAVALLIALRLRVASRRTPKAGAA